MVLLILISTLLLRALTRPTYTPDPLPSEPPRAKELVSKLDPNTAPWQQLALLPNLGPKRAQAIVAYRDQFTRDHPGTPAFTSAADLMNIPGIGQTTADNLSPYLELPQTGN